MAVKVKSHKVDLRVDPSLPTGVWDPAWQKPDVAIRMAQVMYEKLRGTVTFGDDGLQPVAALPALPRDKTDVRRFALGAPATVPGLGGTFRGGSYGEIFRRFAFGPRPAVNFHAQACGFGVDSDGRWFLQAQVGRVGGGWGTTAALQAHFLAGTDAIGGVAWEGSLDGRDSIRVLVTGTDAALKARYADMDAVVVSFAAQVEGA